MYGTSVLVLLSDKALGYTCTTHNWTLSMRQKVCVVYLLGNLRPSTDPDGDVENQSLSSNHQSYSLAKEYKALRNRLYPPHAFPFHCLVSPCFPSVPWRLYRPHLKLIMCTFSDISMAFDWWIAMRHSMCKAQVVEHKSFPKCIITVSTKHNHPFQVNLNDPSGFITAQQDTWHGQDQNTTKSSSPISAAVHTFYWT